MNRTDRAGAVEVTVLMPVFNGERFLDAQIQSILAQDHRSLRLVIADDGSHDRSHDIAMSYACVDRRVEVTRSDENKGLIPTVDRLLSSVETEYFALAD